MAQVKIYAQKEMLKPLRQPLSDVIHSVIVEMLSFPKEKRFHRFIALDAEDYILPEEKSRDYIIIEILMMSGRSEATKKSVIKTLFSKLEQELKISPDNVEIVIFESPTSHWGFRGMTGDEITLNYKINV